MAEPDSKIQFPHPRFKRITDIPNNHWIGFFLLLYRTIETLIFKLLQILRIYRPKRSILAIPSLATRNFTVVHACVYNGSQEEVLGFRPRHLLYRLIKGVPDLEYFENIEVELNITDNYTHKTKANTETKGFVYLQLPWQLPWHPPKRSELSIKPLGAKTLLGSVSLGDYEVSTAPVFFLTENTKTVIVSDIDDTIKDSQIKKTTSFGSIVGSIFKGHYYSYEAISGMAELYRELADQGALIIYLTSTPYQLAPFLLKFLKDNNFPEGPVLMRWLGYGQFRHKWRSLNKVLSTLNNQKCICIGDSGEKDLAIYRRLSENPAFAKHIDKILIREVPGSPPSKIEGKKEVAYQTVDELRTILVDSLSKP